MGATSQAGPCSGYPDGEVSRNCLRFRLAIVEYGIEYT